MNVRESVHVVLVHLVPEVPSTEVKHATCVLINSFLRMLLKKSESQNRP